MTAKPEIDNLIPTSHTATGHADCSVPDELKRIRAWLPFKTEVCQDDRGVRKTKKVPYNAFHRKARYTDRRELMTSEAALQMLNTGPYDGLGIVILGEHGIVGYDADECISNGKISARADAHVATLNTYTEVSFSGTGIHCLAFGTLPARGRKSDGFEMYSDKRYFVVTGRRWTGVFARIEHRETELKAVHEDIFGRIAILKSICISHLSRALGGAAWCVVAMHFLAHGRQSASLARLDDEEGCWYDHRANVCGGVRHLIRLVGGGTPRRCAAWLAGGDTTGGWGRPERRSLAGPRRGTVSRARGAHRGGGDIGVAAPS